jgi:group I intron endonuclease
MIIYKITNTINGRVYIGQTVMSLARRWSQHSTSKKNSPMYNAFRKYGAENFTIEVICSALAPEHLNALEKYFIGYYDSIIPNGYNLTSGGNSAFTRSEHTKKLQSIAMKGHTVSPETRAKIAASLVGRPGHRLGATHTEEVRKLISDKQTGRKLSKETKARMSAAKKGRQLYNSKPIMCIETGIIYANATVAAESLGLQQTSISAVCRGARKSTGGKTFRYAVK